MTASPAARPRTRVAARSAARGATRLPLSRSTVGWSAVHAALALLAFTVGVAFGPVFGERLGGAGDLLPGRVVVAAAVGAVLPAAVVLLCVLARRGAVLAAGLGLLTGVVGVVVATGCGTGGTDGVERLLTSALPATADADTAAAVGLVVTLVSLAGCAIAGYARRPAPAVVPVLVGVGAALSLDAGLRFPPFWFAAALVVLVGACLALLRPPVERSRERTRSLRLVPAIVGTVVLLGAAAIGAAATAGRLPGIRHRAANAQTLVSPPLTSRAAIIPMAQFPAFADGADPVKLTGTTTQRVSLLPMVTLSTFTGETWSTATRFRRAGTTLAGGATGRQVSLTMHAEQAGDLAWLVRLDRPSSVNRPGLGIDTTSGDLVVPTGSRYPASYTVTGAAPAVASVADRGDTPAAWTGPVSTDPEAVPTSIVDFAHASGVGATPYARLTDLLEALRDGAFRVATGANVPTGCGYAQLTALLSPASQVGTSEQYASLFAVSARLLGYDARVVLGFQPQYTHGDSFTIDGADVRAWVQVRFGGAGWLTFDPTPTVSGSSHTRPIVHAGGGRGASSAASSQPPSTHVPTPYSTRAAAKPAPAGTALWWIPLLAVIVLLGVLSPAGVKQWRRGRRRRAGSPAVAVHAAWVETTERLVEAGSPVPRGRSTGEVAAAAPAEVRGEVGALGRLLDRAGYAPESAAQGDADAAWTHARSVRRSLRAAMPWWRRIVAVFDPRPLRRR